MVIQVQPHAFHERWNSIPHQKKKTRELQRTI